MTQQESSAPSTLEGRIKVELTCNCCHKSKEVDNVHEKTFISLFLKRQKWVSDNGTWYLVERKERFVTIGAICSDECYRKTRLTSLLDCHDE